MTTEMGMDGDWAERAFEALRPRLEALAAGELAALNVDLQRAAVAALGVARWVETPEVVARFERLPAQEYDASHTDGLAEAALAAWHVSVALLRSGVGASRALLPASLVEAATEVKQRMLTLLSYHLADDPEAAAEIAAIRSGAGHVDLAVDLERLALLYDVHAETVARDPIHYRATDAADARRLAVEIVTQLGDGAGGDHARWTEMAARAWTHLLATYNEVRAAGLWLFRHEGGAARLPALHTAARRRRAGGDAGADDGGGDDGGVGADADTADTADASSAPAE